MAIANNTAALQNEQTELQNLLNEVNNLPEATSVGDIQAQINVAVNTHNIATDAHNDIRVLIGVLQNELDYAKSEINTLKAFIESLEVEPWVFTLEDGSTVTKAIYVGELPMATVTITGQANNTYIKINDETYTSDATVEIPVGTVIVCRVYHNGDSSASRAVININGTYVYEERSSYEYEYTVNGDVSISLSGDTYGTYGRIDITEQ